MTFHRAAGREPVPCLAPARCRVCELIDRDGPHYQESYRRFFHPEEFGGDPVSATAPGQGPLPAPSRPDIPLAGDVVEAIARRIGADRLAAWWEKQTGQPCGCAERRDRLNRASGYLLKWLGRRA